MDVTERAGPGTTSAQHQEPMKRLIIVVPCVLCASCALTSSMPGMSNLEHSDSTYSVSARVSSSGSTDAKAEALQEASHFCASRGSSPHLVSSDARECAAGGACDEAHLTFSCSTP
jgi:hypothetical protein